MNAPVNHRSSTQIPGCLWFLGKNKHAEAKRGFRSPAFVNFSQN
jgi:hypothetical protein